MNNTTYQTCRPYFGPLKEESTIAFEILEKYEKPCVDAVKELREETNLSLYDCNDMLRCMYRDRELERLSAENTKLQEENTELREQVWRLQVDWESERDYANQMEVKEKKAVFENTKLRELLTFYLGCLTKGHVNCDSCAFSGEDNCDRGRKVIESAKQIGIEVN